MGMTVRRTRGVTCSRPQSPVAMGGWSSIEETNLTCRPRARLRESCEIPAMTNAGSSQGRTDAVYALPREESFLSSSFLPQTHRKERALSMEKGIAPMAGSRTGQRKDRVWLVM